MHYELVTLEKLIKQKSQSGNSNEIYKWINEACQEAERIKSIFMTELFTEKSKVTVERYIQIHQKALLQLDEFLETSVKAATNKSSNYYSQLKGCIEDLLQFIENHFREYLRVDYIMPLSISLKALTEIANKLPLIERNLKDLKIAEKLSEIILQTFNEFTDQGSGFTYEQVYFINKMVNALLKLSKEKRKNNNSNKAIIEVLCLVNFNSVTFYHYCKDQVTEIIGEKAPIIEQLYKLARQQKYFSRLKTSGTLAYNSQRIDVATSLADWLQDMIMLKERELQMQLHQSQVDSEDRGGDSQKIVTNCTVPELGLSTRLFIEAGVFQNKNKKALARFMAKNVITFQKSVDEEFSVDHLYSTIYTTDHSTLDSVQAMLNRMLKALSRIREEMHKKGKLK